MSRTALTTVRDWTGLIASVATVLFFTLYPHAPSAEAQDAGAYRASIGGHPATDRTSGSVTAALSAPLDAYRR